MEDWDQTVFDLAGRKQGILRAFNKIQEKSDFEVWKGKWIIVT